MNESSVSRAVRRWGERVVLTVMVLFGFGIGTAGLALVGERWQNDPVVLDDPLDNPADDVAIQELLVDIAPAAAPETVVVPTAPEPTVPADAPPAPEPVQPALPAQEQLEDAEEAGEPEPEPERDRERRRHRSRRR